MSAGWERRWASRARVAATPSDEGLFLALAPMDGVTDAVFREVITDLLGGDAGVSLCVSEFVRVTRDPAPARVILRHCPELARGGRTRAGVPVQVQLLGGAPAPLAASARIAAELGAPAIDLNFGCPAKTVNNHDGGASLLRYPERLRGIVAAVRDAVAPAIPVSAKIRVGWADDDALEAIVAAAAAGGASWITIHARTRAQGYKPPVLWRSLARASALGLAPLVANGDLLTPDDLGACAAASGCEAFMIGRGAMVDPAIFARARGRAVELERDALVDLWRDYHGRLVASGAIESRALSRVKQWLRFAGERDPEVACLFDQVKVVGAWEAMDPLLGRWARAATGESSSLERPAAAAGDPPRSPPAGPRGGSITRPG
ncbi:MAG: tRNA-dihydrouridine synthase family protein [Myxococcales bacterium]|nr:tRNA-dihydrouridine synthase family protein [Myxococcales bacterium]